MPSSASARRSRSTPPSQLVLSSPFRAVTYAIMLTVGNNQSSGVNSPSSSPSPPSTSPPRLISTPPHIHPHHTDTHTRGTDKSCSATIPCLIVTSINAYNLYQEHWEHWAHMPPLEERPEYPYQNIRSKNFFWGDGDKTLL